jgi:predicted PurR-regulated permease PerM
LAVQDRRSGIGAVDARHPDLALLGIGRRLDSAATKLDERFCLTIAILGSLGAVVLLAFVLVPPVVDQTRQLIQDLPRFINSWETGIDSLADRLPGMRDLVGNKGEHRTLIAAYDQVSGLFGSIPTKVFEIVHVAINIFAVGVMAIYLSAHPALYREWLIALFPADPPRSRA